MALAYPAGCTARKRAKKERKWALEGVHAASVWCVIAPSSATATRPCSIKSAVAIGVDRFGLYRQDDLDEQRLGSERLGRSRSIARQGEFRLLTRFDIDQDVVVLLSRRLAFPVEVRRIAGRDLDTGAAGKDRVLFRARTAQHQVFQTINVIQFGRVDVAVEHDDLEVLGVSRDHFMGIIGLRTFR